MRLTKLDFLRGHFLIAILVDHLGHIFGQSIFWYYNAHGFLWVSAAEGFVLMSGFFIGYLYIFKEKYSLKQVTKYLLKRSISIYLISIFLTIIYTVLVKEFSLNIQMGGDIFNGGYLEMIKRTILFQYNYGWANILALYVPFILVSPLIVYFFRKKQYLPALIPSVILWILYLIFDFDHPYVSHFSYLSWQILFITGIFAGSKFDYLFKVKEYVMKRPLLVFSILFIFVLTVVLSVLNMIYNLSMILSPEAITWIFSKPLVGIGRFLLSLFWVFSVYVIINILYKSIPKFIKNIYEYLGSNSLNSYVFQSILIFLLQLFALPKTYWNNTAIFLLMIFVNILGVWIINKVGEVFKKRTTN